MDTSIELVWLANAGGACNLVTAELAEYQTQGNGNVVSAEDWPNEGELRIVSDAEAAEILGVTEDATRAAREGEPAAPAEQEPEDDGLEKLKAPELDKLAGDEGIDLGSARSNADKVAAIRAAREAKAAQQ
jgi:hypothetical protein